MGGTPHTTPHTRHTARHRTVNKEEIILRQRRYPRPRPVFALVRRCLASKPVELSLKTQHDGDDGDDSRNHRSHSGDHSV